jgi:tetratricopeptide (TPR) repeat protein
MQNSNITNYINKENVINMKSEILCREAEDDFFYFNKINSACKKLNEAVKLSPFHTKSIMLLADICFIKGYVKKALSLYKRASELCKNAKVYGAIAACYNSLNKYEQALNACNTAISLITPEESSLFEQIAELKIDILINMKNYNLAYITINRVKNIIYNNPAQLFYNINYENLMEKINLQKKLKQSNLKIV